MHLAAAVGAGLQICDARDAPGAGLAISAALRYDREGGPWATD